MIISLNLLAKLSSMQPFIQQSVDLLCHNVTWSTWCLTRLPGNFLQRFFAPSVPGVAPSQVTLYSFMSFLTSYWGLSEHQLPDLRYRKKKKSIKSPIHSENQLSKTNFSRELEACYQFDSGHNFKIYKYISVNIYLNTTVFVALKGFLHYISMKGDI